MFNNIFKKKARGHQELNVSEQKIVTRTKALLAEGDWSTAQVLIDNLIKKHPDNADSCWLYGRLLAHQGQYEAAIFNFKQCLSFVADHADCYNSYGATLGRVKRYNEEEEMYKKCLSIDENHHACHYNYGCLCEILSDYKRAEVHFQKAIAAYNKDSNYYVAYGKLLKTIRRYDEAEKKFEFAITIDPKNAKAHYQYSKVLQSMDRLEDAINELKKAIRLNPQNTEYQRILHIMNKSKPRGMPTLPKSMSLSPLLTSTKLTSTRVNNNSSNTPTIATIKTSQSLDVTRSSNLLKKDKHDFDFNLDVVNDDENEEEKDKEKEIQNEQQNNESDNNDDEEDDDDIYLKKANELYENEQYEDADNILKIVLMIEPNNEKAQKLHESVIAKMEYLNEINDSIKSQKQKPSHDQIQSSPASIAKSQKLSEENMNEEEEKKDENIDPLKLEVK